MMGSELEWISIFGENSMICRKKLSYDSQISNNKEIKLQITLKEVDFWTFTVRTTQLKSSVELTLSS